MSQDPYHWIGPFKFWDTGNCHMRGCVSGCPSCHNVYSAITGYCTWGHWSNWRPHFVPFLTWFQILTWHHTGSKSSGIFLLHIFLLLNHHNWVWRHSILKSVRPGWPTRKVSLALAWGELCICIPFSSKRERAESFFLERLWATRFWKSWKFAWCAG